MLRSRDSVNAKSIPFFLVAYYLPHLLTLDRRGSKNLEKRKWWIFADWVV